MGEKVKKVDVNEMINQLVENAQKALKEYLSFSQEQVDKIVYEMTLKGLDNHMYLAKLAVEETGRGVFEDKVIKNMFATEYIYHSIKNEKSVGIIEENDLKVTWKWQNPLALLQASHLLQTRRPPQCSNP